MDLSHNLLGKPGKDREVFTMAFEGGVYFVRDRRFRLHEDGRFYDIPVDRIETRYSMNALITENEFEHDRQRLQRHLDELIAITQTDTSYHIIPFGTGGDNFKNAQDRARKAEQKNAPVKK